MPHAIESSTIRMLKPNGETVGTGFLVAKNLALTCAHVVARAGEDGEGRIRVCFTGQKIETTATTPLEYLNEKKDVALLQIETVPQGVFPLRLAESSRSKTWIREALARAATTSARLMTTVPTASAFPMSSTTSAEPVSATYRLTSALGSR